ncbi:MAG TPA: hypothetical protein VGG33_20510 [Polyangia bacterium]
MEGVWQNANANICPISTRTAKTDIHYLTVEEQDAVARNLQSFKIARYRYKPGMGSPDEHLGFIIEDVGASPAVMADGGHVDLYGYASMLAVSVQAQNREIRRLRNELRALRAEMRRVRR